MNNRIRKIREKEQLSQSEFAARIGVGFSSISKLETGTNSPSERTKRAICSEFNINRLWLETGEGSMEEEAIKLAAKEIGVILRGSYDQSRIDAVVQLLEMHPEEFEAWKNALSAFRAYSRIEGGKNEKTPE